MPASLDPSGRRDARWTPLPFASGIRLPDHFEHLNMKINSSRFKTLLRRFSPARRRLAAASALACCAVLLAGFPAPADAQTSTKDMTKLTDAELRKQLTPEQYRVTRQEGTEPPFRNAYWNNHEPGLYVDIISGEPLFSSKDKFESGTGWPSFTRPIAAEAVKNKQDKSLFMSRTEVRGAKSDAHLGHVFDDGPQPTGQRYCMNSAALRFIPVAKLKEEGYEEFVKLFQ